RVHRRQLVAERHPAAIEGGVDANAFETAEAEQVRDALANGGHRQRLTDGGLDHLRQRRVGGLAALDDEMHRADRLADVVGDRGGGRERGQQCAEAARRNAADPSHQKTRLTRNSSAYVWESSLRDSTHET